MALERLPALAATMLLLWGMAGPVPAQAAKLGDLTVSSDFGEPLRAVVDVVDMAAGVRPLAAELASPQTYAELGIAFPKSLEGATVRLVALPDARWAVRVSSLRAVDEPDFNLVLALTTSSGRQLRHYRLAADTSAAAAPSAPAPAAAAPAGAAASEPAVAVSPVPTPSVDPGRPMPMPTASAEAAVQPPEVPRPADPPASAPDTASAPRSSDRNAAPPAANAVTAPPAAATAASVTARKGDTATSIARRVKPADVSDEQAVIALYRTNERAFAGSVHRLPEGAVLQVPDAIRMREIEPRSARQALRSQPLAATPTAPAVARDRLVLSGGGTGRATSRHGGRGSGAATDAIAFDAAMSEASSRVRDLESIVADLRKLLDMRERQIASAQTELASLQGGARGSDATAAPMLAGPIGAATATLVRVPAKDAPLAPTAAGSPTPDPVIDPLMVGGGVAVLVLLGVLVWRRRRQAARAAGPDTFMS